jgi:serine/threonine protein phosphatase 1
MTLRLAELPPGPGAHAAIAPGSVVYAVGDLHGRSDLLEALLDGVREDAGRRRARRRVLVYLGDYVSRGLDSRRVVELARARPPGFEVMRLQGNHEDLLLRYLDGDLSAARHWFDFDGLEALVHYGVDVGDRAAHDDETLEALRRRFSHALPADHLGFFRSLSAAHDEGGYRFVHAGVRPGVPLAAQRDSDQLWIRRPFLDSDRDHGAVIVHGHSIAPEVQVRPNRIGIDTVAYRSGVLTCLVLEGTARALLQTRAARERS